ncbi:MFS transporter [Bremerella sp. P1]|uniref:MFS transporter n=1 Tax=Bremerella sp. P1 TaxID=3026424 RepID=UPI002367ADAC|nr:MFS transporter [Bremerella sp. P1]WDI40160.1 MFS transporter [Bremerella sp. P1]
MNSAVVTADETSTAPQIAYGREFWLAYFANTALIVCNSSLFRYFDFVNYLGGDEYDLGLITGFGMGGAVLARFAQGAVIDRFGTRVVWLGSLCLLLCAIVGHFIVGNVDGPLIYFLRLCYMVGLAGAFGASITAISLKAPKGRSTELIGVLGSSGFIGLAIGPLIGDIIFAGEAAIDAKINTMFLVALGACVVSITLAYFATRQDKPQRSSGHPSIIRLIREYHPGWMLVMSFAMGVGVLFPQIFLRSYAKEIGIEHISSFFLVYAITAFTCRLLTRKVPERIGVKNAATIGILLLSISLTLYLLAKNPWLLPLPAIVGGMAHALIFPAIIGGGSIAFPKKYRGTGTNLMLVMLDSGGLFGQPLIGLMIAGSRKADLPAYPITFMTVAVLLTVIALLNQRFAKPIVSQEEDQPVLEERSHCVNESL